MGLHIPSGYGQATLTFDYVAGPSNPMAIVLGYDPATTLTAQQSADLIRDRWAADIMPTAHISNNLLFLNVKTVQNPGGDAGFASSNVAGPNTNYCLPPQVAVLVRKVTGVGGRQNRGRLYLPGVTTDSVVEGGVLTSSALTSLGAAFADFFTSTAAAVGPLVVLHTSTLLTPTVITSMPVQSIVATQRRRVR